MCLQNVTNDVSDVTNGLDGAGKAIEKMMNAIVLTIRTWTTKGMVVRCFRLLKEEKKYFQLRAEGYIKRETNSEKGR